MFKVASLNVFLSNVYERTYMRAWSRFRKIRVLFTYIEIDASMYPPNREKIHRIELIILETSKYV